MRYRELGINLAVAFAALSVAIALAEGVAGLAQFRQLRRAGFEDVEAWNLDGQELSEPSSDNSPTPASEVLPSDIDENRNRM